MAGAPGPEPDPDRALKARELALTERRLALDESFPRKWGTVLFSALATVAVACVSAAVTIWQVEEAKGRAEVEVRRAEAQERIENARTALTLYFENIEIVDRADARGAHHLSLIAAVSDDPAVREIFLGMREAIMARRRAEGGAPSEAAAGLPGLAGGAAGDWSAVTAYIQHPPGCRALAERVLEATAALGLRTPGLDEMEAGRNPDDSEIRFYGARQRLVRMQGFEAALEAGSGLAFQAKDLSGDLPDDILEIWIGRRDC